MSHGVVLFHDAAGLKLQGVPFQLFPYRAQVERLRKTKTARARAAITSGRVVCALTAANSARGQNLKISDDWQSSSNDPPFTARGGY
jgi:hypothetical protein